MSTKLVKDFAGYTTFHGLGFIVLPGSSILRRLLWMCLFTLCMSLVIYQVADRVMYYHSNPVNMNYRRIKNSTLRFPAMTVCNKNHHKVSSAVALGLYDFLKNSYSNSEWSYNSTSNLTNNITWEEVLLETAHNKEDLIHRCYFGDRECSHEDFNTTITDYGVCYTFNKDDRNDHAVSSPGVEQGLRLTLNLEAYDYLFGDHGAAGVMLLIHEADDTPLVKSLGHDLQVGEKVLIGLTTVITKNLPEPYGICENKELQFFEKKTTSNCLIECHTKHAVEQCGCRLPFMPETTEISRKCTPHQYFSCREAVEKLQKVRCDCPEPCQLTTYDPYTSNSSVSESGLRKIVDFIQIDRLLHNLLENKEAMYRIGDEMWHSLIKSFEEELGIYYDVLDKYCNYVFLYSEHLKFGSDLLSEKLTLLHKLAAKFNQSRITIDTITRIMSPIISETFTSAIENRFSRLIMTEKKDFLYEFIIDMLESAKHAQNAITMPTDDEYADSWTRSQLTRNMKSIFHHLDVFIEMVDEAYYNQSLNESSIFEACKIYRSHVHSLLETISRWEAINRHAQAENAHLITKLASMNEKILDEHLGLIDFCFNSQDIDSIFIPLGWVQKAINAYLQNNSRKIDIANMLISWHIEYIYENFVSQEQNTNFTERLVRLLTLTMDFNTIRNDTCDAILEFVDLFYIPEDLPIKCIPMEVHLPPFKRWDKSTIRAMRQFRNTFRELIDSSKDYNESIHINNTFIRKNFLEVNIFFRSMRYEDVEQQEGYNIFALLCDIGGSMGLLIGGSVLSLFEILDLIIRQVYLKRRKTGQMEQRKYDFGSNSTSLSVITQETQINKDLTNGKV